ncbi:MAG TPA: acyl-CoA dehydrogenase family protein [Streptosporangiaceae bacterium]|nr:acyl-CoA dehydrogenase family protein [Streptosporangiaceae bacterium]
MSDLAQAPDIEDLDSFRYRLRDWLKENMPPADPRRAPFRRMSDEEELALVAYHRELQRRLYDGGFAGIIFAKEYGGAGLTPAHQEVLNEEIVGYEYPARFQVPTFSPCASVIYEFGTDEQKRRHIPAILRGEEIWMQFLSEPGGGSDVAGAQTTAIRDGDEWVINGSKIWTTGAWWSDWGLCLARTNWDVPKHRGLSVFMLKIHQPGIDVHRIEMLNGSKEFCQEFMTDLRIPDSDRIGEVDGGWTVGTRWMYHEKSLGISHYFIRPVGSMRGANLGGPTPLGVARQAGRLDDPVARQLVGEAHTLQLAGQEATARIARGMASRKLSDQAAGISRILAGVLNTRLATINYELAGASAVAWDEQDQPLGDLGVEFLMRQARQIGGGTVEMSRNGVSERLLGMPRETRRDNDVAFREVPRSAPSR